MVMCRVIFWNQEATGIFCADEEKKMMPWMAITNQKTP